MKPSLAELEARLAERFAGARLAVVDDSHLHAGHTGSAGGAGHFTVVVVSDDFDGLPRLARHRLVYDAVADWMPHRIHALVVKASTPSEPAPAIEPGAGSASLPAADTAT